MFRSKKNTNNRNNNNNNQGNTENPTRTSAIYIDFDALAYTINDNTSFYPGALDFLQKFIEKNIMIVVFSKDENLDNTTMHFKRSANNFKPIILDEKSLNDQQNNEDALKAHNIFISHSSLLTKVSDSCEFGKILEESKKYFTTNETIIIDALSNFTGTVPLAFVGHSDLYAQARNQGIPFIIFHPMVNGNQTITKPVQQSNALTEKEKENSIQFFKAINAYRLLKDYINNKVWNKEKSLIKRASFFEQASASFLFTFESGHSEHEFSGPDEDLKFLTNKKIKNEYYLKMICHDIFSGIILKCFHQNPAIGTNFFEKKYREKKEENLINDFHNISSNEVQNNHSDNILIIEEKNNQDQLPEISGSLSSSFLPPPHIQLSTIPCQKAIYFSLDSIAKVDPSRNFIFFNGALDCIQKLILQNIGVVIFSPLFYDDTTNLVKKLKEKLNFRVLTIDNGFTTKILGDSFIKNKLIVVDLSSLAIKNKNPDSISNSLFPNIANPTFNQIQAKFSFILSMYTKAAPVFLVGKKESSLKLSASRTSNNSLPFLEDCNDCLANEAKNALVPFLIAHPCNDGKDTKTLKQPGYEKSIESEQFFNAIIAYVQLEDYAADEFKPGHEQATKLLNALRVEHTKKKIEQIFPLTDPELNKLWRPIQIGLTSRFVNKITNIGNYDWVLTPKHVETDEEVISRILSSRNNSPNH